MLVILGGFSSQSNNILSFEKDNKNRTGMKGVETTRKIRFAEKISIGEGGEARVQNEEE